MTQQDAQFDAYAGDYGQVLDRGLAPSGESSAYFCRGRLEWLARQFERLGERPRKGLDYGCGVGMAVPFFFTCLQLDSLIGLDVSRSSLETAAKSHPTERVRFLHITEYQPQADLDLIFTNGVFHHIKPEDRPETIRFLARCLRPGGLLALWENNPWNLGTRYVMSRIPFDRDAVLVWPGQAIRLLRAAGFEILRKDFCFIFPRFLRLFRWSEPLLCRLPLGAQYLVLGRLGKACDNLR